MRIVKAKLEDLDQVLSIENECFKKPFLKENMLYELEENPFSNFFVAKEKNEVVGYIIFWITFDTATICKVATKKACRNQGFATKLLLKSEEILKRNHVEFYTLEVRETNLPAINLYKKFGFIPITVKEKYYEDGENAVYMMKGEI